MFVGMLHISEWNSYVYKYLITLGMFISLPRNCMAEVLTKIKNAYKNDLNESIHAHAGRW